MAEHPLLDDGIRRKVALFLSAMMFLVLATPSWDEGGERIGVAAYGPSPLGLPWQAFHVLLVLLLCLPMPAFWSSFLLVWMKARDAGVVLISPLSWLLNYPRLWRHPDVGGPLARFTPLAAFYLLAVAAWIAYTAYLGI